MLLRRRSLLAGASAILSCGMGPIRERELFHPNTPFWAMPGSCLDLDFSNNRFYQKGVSGSVSSLLTCTRASGGSIDDASGNWTQVPANALRVSNKGLLAEQASTNGIRNNTMQGAVAGVVGSGGSLPNNWTISGGDTATVVGSGTQNGIDYIDLRIQNASTTAANHLIGFDVPSVITAAAGQVWTESAFVAIVGGSLANISTIKFFLNERAAGNLQNDSGTDFSGSLTSSMQRVQFAFTVANASTTNIVPQFDFITPIGAAMDITIRIGWPQIEQLAFATSPIRTTSAAATRAADVVSVNTVPVFSGAATLFASIMTNSPANTGAFRTMFYYSDGTNNNRIIIDQNSTSGKINTFITAGGVTLFNPQLGNALNPGDSAKAAVAFQSQNYNAAAGGILAAGGSTAGIPAGINSLTIGSGSGGLFANAYIKRVALWLSRLPDVELANLTT